MLSKIIKLQQCRAVSVSVRSQRNKQIKCSLSSAHFLTFYFLGFGNEEKEKIFPTKIIITAPCLTPWFWRSLVFFLDKTFPAGRHFLSCLATWWLECELPVQIYSPNLSRHIIIRFSLWTLLSVVIERINQLRNDEKIIGLRTQDFVRIFS